MLLSYAHDDITAIYERHVGTVYRVCFTYLKGSKMDIEDAVQSSFTALINSGKKFTSAAHEKACPPLSAKPICGRGFQTKRSG